VKYSLGQAFLCGTAGGGRTMLPLPHLLFWAAASRAFRRYVRSCFDRFSQNLAMNASSVISSLGM